MSFGLIASGFPFAAGTDYRQTAQIQARFRVFESSRQAPRELAFYETTELMTLFRKLRHHHVSNPFRATLSLLLITARLAFGDEINTNNFGFTGPEIFPIDNQVSQLHVADLDG